MARNFGSILSVSDGVCLEPENRKGAFLALQFLLQKYAVEERERERATFILSSTLKSQGVLSLHRFSPSVSQARKLTTCKAGYITLYSQKLQGRRCKEFKV